MNSIVEGSVDAQRSPKRVKGRSLRSLASAPLTRSGPAVAPDGCWKESRRKPDP